MRLEVNTKLLQWMLSKAVKGASDNKMIPLTGLISIKLEDGILTLTTTDAINTLEVFKDGINGDDFEVVVSVEAFSKLIAKTTVDKITMELKENNLEIVGNGKYKIELLLDENNQPVKFPLPAFDLNVPKFEIESELFKTILTTNKAAVAKTMEAPCLTGYYFGKSVITTDSFKICINDLELFEEPILIAPEMMDLLNLVNGEKIGVQMSGNNLLITGENVAIFGQQLDEIENYPVGAIEEYGKLKFKNYCILQKDELLNAIDRLDIFVGPYDSNAIYITTTAEGLLIESKKSNATELVKYKEKSQHKDFTAMIDIELFKEQITAQIGDTVKLWYGHEKAIKMEQGKIIQITSLLEDDRGV